ncbi:Uncharacterized protein APZ42_013584 [Daphnia magna]|uniref:Secreted protein n=1 Tax=Daphnia magna TaxID=35525 RepID=A0A162QL79_9CRUS|nr:Uncharacterized protein APZ42_013584 [Daphnia magna]
MAFFWVLFLRVLFVWVLFLRLPCRVVIVPKTHGVNVLQKHFSNRQLKIRMSPKNIFRYCYI